MFSLLSLLISFSFAKNHGNGIIININKYEKKEASWYYKPDVIVCNDSPYTVTAVKKAVSVWKREGVAVGKIYKETSNFRTTHKTPPETNQPSNPNDRNDNKMETKFNAGGPSGGPFGRDGNDEREVDMIR